MRISAIIGLTLLLAGTVAVAQPKVLLIDAAQTAGIDGRDWDRTHPDATTVDAVHRSVLLRFPGAADAIAAAMREGNTVAKAELVLDYAGYELTPSGYTCRAGLGQEKWKNDPPHWHIVTRPLRRPWMSDKTLGPTFNAHINGAGYWSKYGAGGAEDRGEPLPPAELSIASPTARIDVTSLVRDPRLFADCGVMLRKWETYDVRYRDQWNSYEWAVPTGGHGLTFKSPKLVVTLAPGQSTVALAPAADVPALSQKMRADGSGGKPTAIMPADEQIRQLAEHHRLRKPEWMADWEFARVWELANLGGGLISGWRQMLESGDPKAYRKLIGEILATPPRYWRGWEIQDDLLLWHAYRDALPAPVQDHIRNYWTAWLMPDVPTKEFFHPQSKEAADWWRKTQDWRGRASFFRAGYNYAVSTMNFNHTAAMGALLGGDMIGSEYAMTDGRHCLETRLLRFWNYLDGTSQETLDHYYLGITLSAQKMFADFGPTQQDRLMGRMILDRQLELLISAYHPNLKRILGSSWRTNVPFLFVKQDGIYHALHTLSKRGVLLYTDRPANARIHDMPIYGTDFPAGRCAVQTLQGRWAEPWATAALDDKQLPFEIIATETTRGNYKPPLWQRVYLGRHYGLASQDIKGGTVDVVAQWNRKAESVSEMEDRGTLTMRYSINRPNLSKTSGGTMPYAGAQATFQYRNKAIICSKPRTEKEAMLKIAGAEGVQSLSSTVALWNFRDQPGWAMYIDGQRIEQFPVSLKAGHVITIHDGVSYVGIIPLPATDLGRDREVVISPGFENDAEGGSGKIKPALLIESFNLRRDTPLGEQDDWERITTAAHGGFVVELGDATEYADFAAFQKHMHAAKLDTRWEPAAKVLHVTYRSGEDLMEMGYHTAYAQGNDTAHFVVQPGQHTLALPYRRINGRWPYLPEGIERDTSLAQQGTAGRLEKNGAVLLTEPGRKAYLQTDPSTQTYVGYNPLPDPTRWSFSLPGNRSIESDGKMGMARVVADLKANRIQIDCAPPVGAEAATMLKLAGFSSAPAVEVNGKSVRIVNNTIALPAHP